MDMPKPVDPKFIHIATNAIEIEIDGEAFTETHIHALDAAGVVWRFDEGDDTWYPLSSKRSDTPRDAAPIEPST